MPENVLFSISLPDGTKTTLNQEQYSQAQDQLFAKFPDAQVQRVQSYIADDPDQSDSDSYQVSLPDGTNTMLSASQFAGSRDKLFEKFPEAGVVKVSDMSERYWRPKLDEARAALDSFNQEHGNVISRYEMLQGIENNTPSNLQWMYEHQDEYGSLIKQRDSLQEVVANNPLVRRGRIQAHDNAMSLRQKYLNLADNAETGAERRDYKRAAKLQGDAAELFAAPGQYDRKEGQSGFEKYLSDYKMGAVNVFSDRDFWTRGLTQIARDIDLHGIRKKVEDAEKAKGGELDEKDYDRIISPSEKAQLMSFYNLARAQADDVIGRANDLSSAYRAGSSAAESVGYMAEFLLSQGLANVAGKALSGSANGFSRWLGQALMSDKALARAVRQGVTSIPEMSRAAKIGTEIARPLVQGLWHTGTQLSTLSSMAQMMNQTNDTGELNSIGRGVWLGFADSLVENWSESVGNTIDKGFNLLGEGLGKLGNTALGGTSFGRMARWALNSPFTQTLKEAGFNGFFGEMMEEWAGNAVRLATGLINADEFKQFASIEQQLEMAASFAPMSLFSLGGQVVSASKDNREYRKLADKVKGILMKDGVTQPEIDALFNTRFDTGADIAKKLAPYAQKVLNAGGESVQDDYRTILDFAGKAGSQAFEEAVAEIQNEERRNQMRGIIASGAGKFWQENEASEGEVPGQTVRVITDEAGKTYFILASDADGKLAGVAEDGSRRFFNTGEVSGDRTVPLSDYLQERIDASEKDAEAARMQRELQEKLSAVQERISQDPQIDLGTPEAPRVATVMPDGPTPQGVIVEWKDETGEHSAPLTWKEVGDHIGMPIVALTDAELQEEAAAARQQAIERRDKYNRIAAGTPITVTMPGAEGDEQVPYRFAKAIYEADEDSVRIYVADENGEIVTSRNGEEVWFTEDMVQGLEALAEQAQSGTPARTEKEETADSDAPEESPVSPVQKYTNEAGKVNQTAFMKNEPEEWAKWNDEQNQDGGADSMEALGAAISELDKKLSENEKARKTTSNPDDRARIKEEGATLSQRRGRLASIYDKYVAAANAAKEEADAAKRAEFERAAAEKKEAERKAAAKIQDDLKEDSDFIELAENYANQKKTAGASETINVQGKKYRGRWVVSEVTTPKPSHNPLNDFAPTPGFPIGKAGNSNHYDKDKRAQEITREMAANYDERAVQEPVVVSEHGIVLSGNGRTQAALLAAAQQTDAAYQEYIRQYPYKWGLTAEQIDEYAHPFVYFELDEDVEYSAALFDAFNRATSKQQSVTETAAKVAQMTSEELVMRLDRLFREIGDDINNLYKNPQKVNDLLNMLQEAGIFNANERARYVDEFGNLSGAGEDLVESVLFGTIFSSSDDSVRAAMNDKSIRRAVAFAFPTLVRLRSLSGGYSLIDEMTDAVSLLATAKANNGGKADNAVIDYMLQGDLFSGETPVVKATVQLLAQVLNKNTYGSLRAVLNQYIERAENASFGQLSITEEGEAEVETRERILRDVLTYNNINIEAYGNTGETQSGVPADDEVRSAAPEQGSGGAGTDGEGTTNPQTAQGEGSDLDLIQLANELANANRRIKKLQERVAKWKAFLGNAFDVAVGVEDIEKIEDDGVRNQVLSRQRSHGDVEGWYDTKSGKSVIYLPNIPDQKALDRKIMHEVISHKGIRGLFKAKGEEEFGKFCDWVWGNLMNDAARSYFLNYPGVVELPDLQARQRAAADEFLAHAAEENTAVIAQLDEDFWARLVDALKRFVNDAIGEDVFGTEDGWFSQLLKDAAKSVQESAAKAPVEGTGALFSVTNAFSKSRGEFDAMQKLAEQKRGIVATGLYDVAFPVYGVPRHNFTGSGKQAIEKARKWAEGNIVGSHKYHEGRADEFSYEITGGKNGSIGEMLSKISTQNSENLGVHLAVLRELPAIIDASYDIEIHADYMKENGHRTANSKVNPSALIHRLYGAVNIEGQIYRVKTTIEEHRDKANDAYTYQVTKVELLISGSATSNALSNSTISAANLLKGVEKSYDSGRKLLDAEYFDVVEAGNMDAAGRLVRQAAAAAMPNTKIANRAGKPVVVYHGTSLRKYDKDYIEDINERPFTVFSVDREMGAHFGDRKQAENRAAAKSEANSGFISEEYIYPVFLNIESPAFTDDVGVFDYEHLVPSLIKDDVITEDEARYVSSDKELKELLESKGYDGLWYSNRHEGAGDSFVAFYPEQIKSAEPVTRDDEGEIIPLSERFNPEKSDIRFSVAGRPNLVTDIVNDEQEGTALFSVKGKKGGKSLVGIHNISARKLAAAVKTGGLANPSMAVIDMDFQKHEDFGEISLIAPSSLVESETGRNAGTYTGDAWTPTYPGVSKQMNDKGWDKFFADVRDLPDPISHDARNDWREYMDSDRLGRSLYWWFLNDEGKNPEIIRYTSNLSEEDRAVVRSFDGKRVFGTDEDAEKAIALYRKLADPDDVAHAERKVDIKEGRSGTYRDYMIARNEDIDNWGLWTQPVVRLIEDLQGQLRREGAVADYETYKTATDYVHDNNLDDAFEAWLRDKEKKYGVKSVLFAGFTRDGDRKYLPNTVENASRLMNQEPDQNSYGNGGVSATRSLLLERMDTLSEIRKNRGLLGAFDGYASDTEEYKEASDNWFNVINTLSDMQKVDSNQFINIDIAEARLQEAIQERNPIKYLNREYRYHIPEDGEFADLLKASLKEIKGLPSKYFETKFKRPVYLNEFAAAVVPANTRADVRKELEKAGLPVFEYDSSVEGSRQEAVLKASEVEGVRFSIASPVQREMDNIKAIAQANGSYMKAPNGKETNLSEEQWLLVRTRNFLRYFGDWINDPKNASKLLDENGEPAVVFHGSSWNPLDEEPGGAVFRDSYRGTGSGDNGFFGRGFYFTYGPNLKQARRSEASYYGPNVTEAFLNIRNPFMFNEALYSYTPGKDNYGSEKESVVIINMVKLFPELVKDYRLSTIDSDGYESGEITLEEYAKMFDDVYKNKRFVLLDDADERDRNIVELCADPVHHEQEVVAGHVVEWDDYKFRMKMYRPGANEDAQLAFTHYYLSYLNDFWREDHRDMAVSVPSHMFSSLFESEEFTDTLKEKGYDGVLQSAYGDEAVAFNANQIKSATDTSGEFSENTDIRFSVADFGPVRFDQTKTKAFKDWFKGSKVVDENGNPLVVYRGASFDPLAQEPGMGVIKPQRFFSPSERYANRYGLTRAYWLNIQNPFDVRKPEDAAILQAMMPEGRNIVTGPSGALDWTELSAFDLDEFIDEHPEYDGMVLDEGGDPDGNGGVSYRGVSFMPFIGGTQVKSATGNNGEFSPSNPDVRFSVREYRSFVQAQQTQKQPGTDYPEVLFSLSRNNRATIEAWLRKRQDLSAAQRGALVNYLEGLDNPKLQLATAKWFSQGTIILPEDMSKVEQAVSVAGKAKVDPLQYSSPMELLEAHADFRPTEKRINPDDVPTLHKAGEYPGQGIIVYDVDEGQESRKNMREIINSHFGKEASPWCLLQGDGNGNLTRESEQYWRNYNAYPKQVAFKDGKLLAFSANDRKNRLWWDRQDRPHSGIPVAMKMPNDDLGRSAVYEMDSETGMMSNPHEIHRGNKQNGTYETWADDGETQISREQYKDGKRHGTTEVWHRSNGKLWYHAEFNEGKEIEYESWYDNGNPWVVRHGDPDGRTNGEELEYHENGQLSQRQNYKHGKWDGLKERWNRNGVLTERTEFKDGKRHGKEERWFDNGQRESVTNYENGSKQGLMEEWYWNGNKRSEINYDHHYRVGISRTWHESGNPKSVASFDKNGDTDGVVILYHDIPNAIYTREHWKHGNRDGLSEMFWPDGKPRQRENWRGGLRNGMSEQWFDNGVLGTRQTFKDGELDGIVEHWDSGGKLWFRTEFKEGREVRSLGNTPNESVYGDVRFSVVTDQSEIDRLEKEPTVTLYRAMELIDGRLYPPMSQKEPNAKGEKGKLKLREGVTPGMWQKADEDPDKAYQKKPGGPYYYDLKKVKGSDVNGVLYNPYLHLSASPLNDQFSAASTRPNLVTVACEVPVSEFTGQYRAEKANDSVGPKDWHSGTVTAQLGEGRQVVLSRWAKIVRIVPDSEVAAMVAPKLVEKGIVVPAKVVTPSLKSELESRGVKFSGEGDVRFSISEPVAIQGKLFDEEGNATHFEHDGGLPTWRKRKTLVERTYRRSGAFSFTGKNRIESAGDVAYIFKELENAATENSFIVFVKGGKPTIIHTGIGTIDRTEIDSAPLVVGLKDFAPDQIYMVHNHPSGSVVASTADGKQLDKLQMMAGNIPVTGIIIDTVSGEYGVFDQELGSTLIDSRRGKESIEVPLDVLTFDRMVFAPDYRANIGRGVNNKEEVAAYLSAHRLGNGEKLGALLLNKHNQVVCNLVFNENILNADNADVLAGDAVEAAVRSAASSVILYGDMRTDKMTVWRFKNAVDRIGGGNVRWLDTVKVDGNHTRSLADGTLMDSGDDAGIRFSVANQRNDVFVSNAEKAVDEIGMEKATPQQWLKMIEGKGGLKAGEDKWIGLSDWLKSSDRKTLTKQEVLDYIAQNRIQIEEVHYADLENTEAFNNLQEEFNTIVFDDPGYMWEEADRKVSEFYIEMEEKYGEDYLYEMNPSERVAEDNLLAERERWNADNAPDDNEAAFNAMVEKYGDDFRIAFGQNGGALYVNEGDAAEYFLGIRPINEVRMDYTTEKLDNKREIALTVPTIEPWHQDDDIHFGDAGEGRTVAWIRFGDTVGFLTEDPERARDYLIYKKEYQKEINENREAIDRGVTGRRRKQAELDLIAAEQKLDKLERDFADVSGARGRVLVIDEIQSKRHQEGREKGYVSEELKKLQKEYDEYADEVAKRHNVDVDALDDVATLEEKQRAKEFNDRISELRKQGGVPAAPFEKNWHELAMKRMLRLAAEEGYDYVAWTTGDQQAERYNIGGVVKKIDAGIEQDGGRATNLFFNDGGVCTIIHDGNGNVIDIEGENSGQLSGAKNISEIVGKDLASDILSITEKGVDGVKTYEGNELRIGGEGMRGFYDDILPRFMNKYGKKWGVKVQDITLPALDFDNRRMHAVPVTREMKESVMQGQVMFSVGVADAVMREGIGAVVGRENVGDFYMDLYREIPKEMRRGIIDRAMGNGMNIQKAISDEVSQAARSNDESTGLLRLAQVLLNDYAAGEIDENTSRYALWRGANGLRDGDLLELASDRFAWNRINATPGVRFSVSESLNEANNEAKESVDEAKAGLDKSKKDLRELLTITKAMGAQKEYDKKTVEAVSNLAKRLMKDQYIDSLSRREVSRLLGIVRTSVGRAPKTVKKNADAIVEIVIEHLLKREREALNNLVSKTGTKTNSTGVEVQGELDVQGQKTLKAYKAGVKLDVGKVDDGEDANTLYGMRARLQQRLSSKDDAVRREAEAEDAGLALAIDYKESVKALIDDEALITDELKDAAAAVKDGVLAKSSYEQLVKESAEAIRENHVEQIQAIRDFRFKMQQLLSGSAEAKKSFLERERNRIEEIHHIANSDMQGRDAGKDTKPQMWSKMANSPIVRFFTAPLATFDQMLRLFGEKNISGEGYLYNKFMRDWNNASEKEYIGQREAKAELDKKASEVFGEKMLWSDLYDIERKMPTVTVRWWDVGGLKDHELTQGQLLYIYMVNKMADGRMKLRRMGINEEAVEAIRNQMDERFIKLADWLQDEFLVDLRNKYNAVHERLFGASMAAIENYFPLKINKRDLNKNEDIAAPDYESLPSTTTGSIIKRRRNSKALDLLNANAFSVVIEHIDQMEQWAAFAEFNKDVNTLLSYKRFRNQVQNMATVYGAGMTLWNNFKDVCRIAGGAYHPQVGRNQLDTAAVNVAKGVTSAKISFRIFTALKQFLSMPAFVSDANIGYLAKNMATPWLAWNWAMENLPLFEKRWRSRIAGDTRLMSTEADWKFFRSKIYDTLSRWGMSPNAFVDAWTVAVGAHSMYRTRYDRYIKEGFTEEQADKKAKQDATILYNETQQSNENAFLSTAQLDRTVFATMITVFRNSSMGYQRQVHDAIRNLGKHFKKGYMEQSIDFMTKQLVREGLSEDQAAAAAERRYSRSVWRDATRLGTFAFLVEFAWNLGGSIVYLLFGDDDDKKEEMLWDAFRHAMIGGTMEGLAGGNVMSEALDMMAKGENLRDYDPTLLPIFSDLKRTYSMFGYDWVAATNELVNLVVQAGIGVNPQTIEDAVVAVIDACNGDMDTSKEAMLLFLRVLQVPQSQLDQLYIDELGVKARSARGMSPAQMAGRYADYKLMRGAGKLTPLYSEELEEKRKDAFEKRFKKLMKERKGK